MNRPNLLSISLETRTEIMTVLALAAAGALLVKAPDLFSVTEAFYLRNLSLLLFPAPALYLAWKREATPRQLLKPALALLAAGIVANAYPFEPGADTEQLLGMHLPVALWLAVGVIYSAGEWERPSGRMAFVRFSGELFIVFVLLGLGGGVLTASAAMLFGTVGIDMEPFFEAWLLPCGVGGAAVIATWLAESRSGAVEQMAPLLARLFTPLFALLLLGFLGTLLWTGPPQAERELLIAFDLLLLLVLGLLLFSISARDPQAPPSLFDLLQLLLVVAALAADGIALWAIAGRISEMGLTPNRVAGLGLNLVILVNLAGSAHLYARFLRGRGSFGELERWQTSYLPVYAAWAAAAALLLPPLFGFA